MFHCILFSFLLCESFCQIALKNKTFVVVEVGREFILGECEGRWEFSNVRANNTVTATQSNVGFYYCSPTEHLVFIIARDPKYIFKLATSQTWMSEDTATFEYSAEIVIGLNAKYVLTMAVTDPSGVKMKDVTITAVDRDRKPLVVIHDHIFSGYGVQTFYCSLHYETSRGDWLLNHVEFKTLNVTVYQAPKNVKPNRMSTEIGKDITCTSESYPTPDYKWVCQGDGWSSNGENLTIQQLGSLSCSCNVRVTIDGKTHEGSWDGTVRGTGGGAKHFLTGFLVIATTCAHLPGA